ncbi:hypothetical protein [Streptomyces sp. NPDC002676]
MAVDQLPGQMREFASYLNGLLARLDPGGGWSGVFWQRDPEGMRACRDGREVPPWDVVEALLQDLAAEHGPAAATAEKERARTLHAAALSAYDARPGARDSLGDRLDVMLREQRYAAERQAELGRLIVAAATREEAQSLHLDLAWARDDHERATARCAELRSRMARLEKTDRGGADAPAGGDSSAAGTLARTLRTAEDSTAQTAQMAQRAQRTQSAQLAQHAQPAQRTQPTVPAQAPAPAASIASEASGKVRKRRRGSARFAGAAEDGGAPGALPQTPDPAAPEASARRRAPRGARFAWAGGSAERAEPRVEEADGEGQAAVAEVVERLVRLRAEERTGEAHVLLVEATQWPAARFPLLADALRRAGLGADWATLLWEAASLPAERLVAAADALEAAGRAGDGQQILRQGVARPAAEVGAAVLGLDTAGRDREVGALLDAYVRARTPEEAARSVAADPHRLVPLLLKAAQGVSQERYWDLVHALRVAGFAA